ncbi:MAG: hypothetical protein JRI25_03845 [Deltaproteobacteria bacterium]|nr:hypothetical protein [Deltaproteobacteria bacterium]
MHDIYRKRLESVATDLEWLDSEVMFFGAGVLPLYLDEERVAAEGLRPTDDVDTLLTLRNTESRSVRVLVDTIEAKLRKHSWKHDTRPHRRNPYAYLSPNQIAVDFVFDQLCPADDRVVLARHTAELHELPSGRTIRIPTPALFLVCKAEASRNPKRWEGAYDSHDIEDIALLMAGCTRLEPSVEASPDNARDYLRNWARELRDGESEYGQQALACLEGNWPRGVDIAAMDRLLAVLA